MIFPKEVFYLMTGVTEVHFKILRAKVSSYMLNLQMVKKDMIIAIIDNPIDKYHSETMICNQFNKSVKSNYPKDYIYFSNCFCTSFTSFEQAKREYEKIKKDFEKGKYKIKFITIILQAG